MDLPIFEDGKIAARLPRRAARISFRAAQPSECAMAPRTRGALVGDKEGQNSKNLRHFSDPSERQPSFLYGVVISCVPFLTNPPAVSPLYSGC